MSKRKYKGEKTPPYDFLEEIGHGGNANIYRVHDPIFGDVALKQLKGTSPKYREERKARFQNEIKVMRENYASIKGIIPILQFSNSGCWYTMPLAVPITKHIERRRHNIKEIVEGVIQLSETLSKLHSKQLSHRDIKPENVYYYNDRYYLGDFGLVDLPNSTENLTQSNRALGAIFTMAPEMRRDPKNADGRKADVYSLAKTLWILLTNEAKGFDGQYSFIDPEIALSTYVEDKNSYYVEIEELLVRATDNKPENRPDMEQFTQNLQQWIDAYGNFRKMQENKWRFINSILFGKSVPRTAVWETQNDIINVLNTIRVTNSFSHMMFPSGGGLDFALAEKSAEPNCICLHDENKSISVVKPKALFYERFEGDSEWNYFFLELHRLDRILEGGEEECEEHLTEDYPGHYVSARDYCYGVYDYDTEEPLPEGSRVVNRFTSGNFLFVSKIGPYNNINATYDARHNRYSSDQLRDYMTVLKNNTFALMEKGADMRTAVNAVDRYLSKEEAPERDEDDEQVSVDYSMIRQMILDHLDEWDFSSAITEIESSSVIRYYIVLKTQRISLPNDDTGSYVLCQDGHFHPFVSHKDTCLYAFDRKTAVDLNESVKEKLIINFLRNLCSFYDIHMNCSIDIQVRAERCGKPSHLFTEEEVREAMYQADDRVSNTLVIDENGYVQIIPFICDRHLYPVVYETWQARNRYVGKYADLSDVQKIFHEVLYKWLRYLQDNHHQRADGCSMPESIDELLNTIEGYYN